MRRKVGRAPTRKPVTICGLDEVGRGPLAGPLVAAAVVFPPGFSFAAAYPDMPFRDSKRMTRLQRERVFKLIHDTALVAEIRSITVDDINAHGIGWANRAIFERLIQAVEADLYIVDGNLKLNNLGDRAGRVRSLVRADETQEVVVAASILAKLKRDWMMEALHKSYPVYHWDRNKGYGTRQHIEALRQHGPCRLHRRRFVETALAVQLPLWPPAAEPDEHLMEG